jgi:hypothetical protein
MSCQVKHLTSAKPATVYDLLMDVEHWSDWMPTVTAATWEQPGDPNTGLGGIRRVRNGLSVTRDKVTGGARPHHHAYASTLPRYFPLKDYQGDVRIEQQPNGPRSYGRSRALRASPAFTNYFGPRSGQRTCG